MSRVKRLNESTGVSETKNKSNEKDMTQDMGNKISHHNQAVARELAGSRQALGRLMSMARSWLGGGKEQARSWLGYGLEQTFYSHAWNKIFPNWEQNIPTLGTKHSQTGNKKGLRLVISLLLMLFVGVNKMWGFDEGLYYIKANSSNQFYLCPAICYYDNNVDQPHLTTFKTGGDQNSIWKLIPVPGEADTYYIIHYKTGRYLKSNDGFKDFDGGNHRKAVHLEVKPSTLSDDFKFCIKNNSAPYQIYPQKYRLAGDDNYSTPSDMSFNPRGSNQNYYVPQNGSAIGIIGLYSNSDANSKWIVTPVTTASIPCATPIIKISGDEINISYPYSDETGITIYYTTDGTKPTTSSSSQQSNNFNISASGVVKVRAFATKTGFVNSDEAVVSVNEGPFLIQSKECSDYYLVPSGDGTKVNTSSIANANMQWTLQYAGSSTGGVPYYYLLNNNGKKIKYGSTFAMDNSSADNNKFCVIGNENPGYYYLLPISEINKGLFKKNGNISSDNATNNTITPSKATDYLLFQWKFIACNDEADQKSLFSAAPFSVSDETETYYYHIASVGTTDYYIIPPADANGYATTSNTSYTDKPWFFKVAASDNWLTYYYIINAETEGYMYFNIADGQTGTQSDAISIKDVSEKDASNEDRFQFIVVRSTITNACYIVPKRYANNFRNSKYYGIGIDGTDPLKSIWSRGTDDNNAKWTFVSTTYTNVWANPEISCGLDGKITITNGEEADGAAFYYTMDGNTVPSIGSPQYNSNNKPTVSTGKTIIKVRAIATGKSPSNVVTMTIVYNPTVTYTADSYTYTGSAQAPVSSVDYVDTDNSANNIHFEVTTNYTISYKKGDAAVTECINADTYTVVINDVAGDDVIVCGTATFTISPLTATLSWDNISLPYNKTAQVPTATVGNLVSGDECTVTVSVSEGDGIDVGSYTATATGLSNSNYALPAEVTQAFSITKKDVTFSGITAAGKVYDKTTTATLDYSSVTFGGLIAGDVLTISATGAFVDANAGENKTVNITDPVLGGGSVANYQLATEGQQTTTTATISKKPVTVSGGVTVQNKVYDGTTTATFDCSSATIDGKIAGDDLTVSATGTFANPNVGEGITVTFTSFVLGGESADNYVLESSGQQASTTANITPATLTVTADAKTKVFGEADPALTYTPTGLAEGDVLADILNNGALTRTTGEDVGSYAIGQGTLDLVSNSGNYTLSYVGANLTITAKSLNEGTELAEGITIEITKSGDAYVPVVQNNGTDINVNDYTISTSGDPDSKYYEVTIEGANNYSGSVTIKYANYKSGKKDTTDETENWSGTFVSDSGDGDIAIPSGMSAYIVTGVNGNAVEVEELAFIPEGVPVLLLSDNFAYCFVVKAKEGEGTADTSDNLLEEATGTTEERTMAVGTVYLVYNGEFVLNMPGELPAGTVYLPKSAVAGSRPVYARLFINWGETTGIENAQISTPDPQLSGPWYTLDGRRLTNKPVNKGLYLRNREKIIIR